MSVCWHVYKVTAGFFWAWKWKIRRICKTSGSKIVTFARKTFCFQTQRSDFSTNVVLQGRHKNAISSYNKHLVCTFDQISAENRLQENKKKSAYAVHFHQIFTENKIFVNLSHFLLISSWDKTSLQFSELRRFDSAFHTAR